MLFAHPSTWYLVPNSLPWSEEETGAPSHTPRWLWRQTQTLATESERAIPELLSGRCQGPHSPGGLLCQYQKPNHIQSGNGRSSSLGRSGTVQDSQGRLQVFLYRVKLGRACWAMCSEWPGGQNFTVQGNPRAHLLVHCLPETDAHSFLLTFRPSLG